MIRLARRLLPCAGLVLTVTGASAAVAAAPAPDEAAPEGATTSAPACDCPCQDEVAAEDSALAEVPEEEEDPVITEAKAIYERGVADYAASRYTAAVDAWLEAFDKLPTNYETAKIRAELIYNVATAQKKAYDIDRDIEHLRRARQSLERFAAQIDDIYPEGEERERERSTVTALLDELANRIALAEEMEAERQRELALLSRPEFDAELDAQQRKRNRSLINSGAVLLSIGAVGLGTMGAGIGLGVKAENELASLETGAELDERRELIYRGELGNGLVFAGALFGGLTALTGATLLGVGVAREKKRKAYIHERAQEVQLVPWGNARSGGLTLSGRF